MAMKSIILITVLMIVLGASQTKAQLLPPGGLVSVININGVVYCSVNSTIVVDGSNPTPPFPNALVQLTCGENVVASAVTNDMGGFDITLTETQALLTTLLSSCNVIVVTPVSTCNAALPTESLQAPLRFVGNILDGLFTVTTLSPILPFTLLDGNQ